MANNPPKDFRTHSSPPASGPMRAHSAQPNSAVKIPSRPATDRSSMSAVRNSDGTNTPSSPPSANQTKHTLHTGFTEDLSAPHLLPNQDVAAQSTSMNDFQAIKPTAIVTDNSTDDGDLIGKIVEGRYKVLRKMGEGGMGTVYLAEHITIEKKVALKVLLHDYARKTDLKERFLQEAKAAARIGHENIVDITDFGDTPDGSVFFAMEFLEGEDLSQLIRKTGPIVWGRAKPILLQICRALGAAHAKGIIHRDMKPENIYLIEREGRADFVKVLDFGIAKMSMEESEQRLTRTGMIFGTPEYMSPEQAQGNKPDHRVDIYAVGVIMYEMLTGQVPFKADTFMGILTKHLFEQPVPPSQINPAAAISAEIEHITLKALSKERNERFQSMAEMAAAISQVSGRMTRPTGDIAVSPRFVTASSSGAAVSSREKMVASSATANDISDDVPRSRNTLWFVLGGILVAAVISVVFFTFLRPQRNEETKSNTSAPVSRLPQHHSMIPNQSPSTHPNAPVVKPRQHAIKVQSSPVGAKLFRGTVFVGTTPTMVQLEHSDNKILFTLRLDGYKEESLEVTPVEDQSFVFQLRKLEIPPVRVVRPKTGYDTKAKLKTAVKKKEIPKQLPAKENSVKIEPKPKQKSEDPSNDLMNPFDK